MNNDSNLPRVQLATGIGPIWENLAKISACGFAVFGLSTAFLFLCGVISWCPFDLIITPIEKPVRFAFVLNFSRTIMGGLLWLLSGLFPAMLVVVWLKAKKRVGRRIQT
ncbi:hypothetical protein N0754_18995 [Pseudomonas aeruginosa]|nr:hypothetical protein [Pseudomonas aeruginosa]MCS9764325.1 hypothetical protein [Pseudomonas aeruginosa]MCS9820501.1 hypothetical protein [Pseudomonas aeruginosa]MCT0241082.1 hypothetical protein [Pseudomonas aeruginosa]MCT0528535.1 hypothetical protein [Pseudomonas aeruginosa]